MNFTDDKFPIEKIQADGSYATPNCEWVVRSIKYPKDFVPFPNPDDDSYKDTYLEEICELYQWQYFVPIFNKHEPVYSFNASHTFPFLKEIGTGTRSNFSVVRRYVIHRRHIELEDDQIGRVTDDDGNPLVAVKQLLFTWSETAGKSKEVARNEINALNWFKENRHRHLIRVIACYSHGSNQFFMFPWAPGGNLRNFWDKYDIFAEKSLNFGPRDWELYIEWFLRQLKGLAEAIKILHSSKGKPGETCRHGDLKPENILCFGNRLPSREEIPTDITLVITDAGLAKFHEKETQARLDPTTTQGGTRRYAPPEVEIDKNHARSRRYDIWSLGLLYLEFLIWILYGKENLDNFHDNTMGDYCFEIYPEPRVKPIVTKWIEAIKGDPRCSSSGPTALGRLIDLIESRLLVVPYYKPHGRSLNAMVESQGAMSANINANNGLPQITVTRPTLALPDDKPTRADAEATFEELEKIYNAAKNEKSLPWINWDGMAEAAKQGLMVISQVTAYPRADINEQDTVRLGSLSCKGDEVQQTSTAYDTDSGYASASLLESEMDRSKYGDQPIIQPVQDGEEDIDDTSTEYSVTLTTPFPKVEAYISELAGYLSDKTRSLNVDQETLDRVSESLPELLKAFALKIGHQAPSQIHRDVMVFVHKYRRQIAASFTEEKCNQTEKEPEEDTSNVDTVGWQSRMSLLWSGNESSAEAQQEILYEMGSGITSPAMSDNQPIHDSLEDEGFSGGDNLAEDEDLQQVWLLAYQEFIPSTEAFKWLLARVQKEFHLVPTGPNTIQSIGRKIMSSLPSARKISKRASTQSCSARFELQWNAFQFFEKQEYSDRPDKVLEGIITVTGSSLDAQAATCAQYTHQTWPLTGETTLQLLKDVLGDRDGRSHKCELSDGTVLSAWVNDSKFIVEVSGVAVSIVEIGEQFAWLGATLRTSTRQSGLVYCTPYINILQNKASSSQSGLQPLSTDITCEIGFTMEEVPQTPASANGQCWHDIFRNPVVVKGYPILRRAEQNTGLEVSLNVMAGLARTQRVDHFNGKIYIKGFSTMLIPTRRNKDILCWHLIYNKDGSRISYLDDNVGLEQDITDLNLEGLRHILGWCSEAQVLADCWIGSAKASYSVARSELPNPGEGCALAQTWVSAGRIIVEGPTFHLGTKDTPQYSHEGGYAPRLVWLATRLVLLWDERDKRGWLVNGTSALLHVLRASLKHDKEGVLGDIFLCGPEDLEGSGKSFTADSAIKILLKDENRSLRLYGPKDGNLLLEDRINQLYNVLEKLIDHQARIAPHFNGGLWNKPRKFLEGWDFEDLMLATDCDMHARVATLSAGGKAWVDLIRAVQAVTLVGRGFGDLIRPTNEGICDHWTELPRHRYYIASCFSDLNKIVGRHGGLGHDFVRLSQALIWHTPTTIFESCQCRGPLGGKCEPVQTIFPEKLSERLLPRREAISQKDEGAVIFGPSSQFSWVWPDDGLPEEGDVSVEVDLESLKDSGIGSSLAMSTSSAESNARALISPSDFRVGNRTPNSAAPINHQTFPRQHYKVGIICALEKELRAVRALFDSEHGKLKKERGDDNYYRLGTMGNKMVVTACLPAGEYGASSAASVASNMKRSFPELQFCLVVGIAGGAPSEQNDIRLGDVVVGIPQGRSAMVQYDLGKHKEGNVFEPTGALRGPPRSLTAAINDIRSSPNPPSLGPYLDEVTKRLPQYCRPAEEDILYESCNIACQSLPGAYPGDYVRQRHPRPTTIHYGPIGSGNSVIKNASRRDSLAREHGVLCFEMEAAGVANVISCLVIRGICDYCDVYKNDDWQEYAAANAAAYAKLFLSVVHVT
ncbi:unnamed protein product [Clonostachys rosea]|uniref:Protein kinase domain-containing protein n=1 Tax=Bionectria ochroleuca TaxID=29856 RepID=A0ABY6V144_BIOOC|nr:unnamed protein product [Clonostachys rosea]